MNQTVFDQETRGDDDSTHTLKRIGMKFCASGHVME